MDLCGKCGAELGVGRFCLNCGHRIGAPVAETTTRSARVPSERHRAAAEAARRLQRPDRTEDEEWFLPGREEGDRPSRLHWAAWVLGAVALVAGVLLVLSLLDEDNSTATDESTTAPASAGSGSGDRVRDGGAFPTGPLVDVARGARVKVPATAPPTRDLNGRLVPYEAKRMVDGVRKTAWRMPGDGTGTEITIFLDRRAVITRVGLVNGYAKRIRGIDWYPHNRRIVRVTWTFDDGTSVEQVLAERRGLQLMDVDPVRTRSVILTLTGVTIPGSGRLGRDYTAISTIALIGKRAG